MVGLLCRLQAFSSQARDLEPQHINRTMAVIVPQPSLLTRSRTWLTNVMNHGNSDPFYSTLWKSMALISYVVIFINGTSHPIYINDPICRWLAVGSYTLVFLAGLWLWMGSHLCASCNRNSLYTGTGGNNDSAMRQSPPQPRTGKIYISENAWHQSFHCSPQCPRAFGILTGTDCLSALEPCKKCIKKDYLRTWQLYSTPSGRRYHTYLCGHIQNKLSGDAVADRGAVRTLTPCTCAVGVVGFS